MLRLQNQVTRKLIDQIKVLIQTKDEKVFICFRSSTLKQAYVGENRMSVCFYCSFSKKVAQKNQNPTTCYSLFPFPSSTHPPIHLDNVGLNFNWTWFQVWSLRLSVWAFTYGAWKKKKFNCIPEPTIFWWKAISASKIKSRVNRQSLENPKSKLGHHPFLTVRINHLHNKVSRAFRINSQWPWPALLWKCIPSKPSINHKIVQKTLYIYALPL